MGKVAVDTSISLDGFITGPNPRPEAGLGDEIHLHVVPVLLGAGTPLFDQLGAEHIELEQIRHLETPGATHLSYRVVRGG
jgi:hypothetical protein